MKKLMTITSAAMLVAGAASAGEGVKAGAKGGEHAYGGCGYGAAVRTATAVPDVTPVPTQTASETETKPTPKTGG
jgi:hypothetical protein